MRQTIPVIVRIGKISRAMEEDHYIDSIELFANDKSVGKVELDPKESKVPEAEFSVNVDQGMVLKAVAHCTVDKNFESTLTIHKLDKES